MVEGLGFRVFRVWRRGVEVVWGLGCLGLEARGSSVGALPFSG